MRPRISLYGNVGQSVGQSVRPSVRPSIFPSFRFSVGNLFFFNANIKDFIFESSKHPNLTLLNVLNVRNVPKQASLAS